MVCAKHLGRAVRIKNGTPTGSLYSHCNKSLAIGRTSWIFVALRFGGTGNGLLAQLEERLNGIEEVSGSNPLGSTSILQTAFTWVVYFPLTSLSSD